MNPLYDFEDIDDYVQGRMSEADNRAFEAAMEADPQLARKVDALRAEAVVLGSLRRESLLEKLTEWDKETPQERRKDNPLWYRHWSLFAVAAAAAGLLVWAVWQVVFGSKPEIPGVVVQPVLPDSAGTSPRVAPADTSRGDVAEQHEHLTPAPSKTFQSKSDYQVLTAQFYEPHKHGTLMSESVGGDTTRYGRALKLYDKNNKNDYTAALALLLEPEPRQWQDFLYLRAHTYYQLGRFAEAAVDFRALQQAPIPRYRYNAQWGEIVATLAQMPASRSVLDVLLQPIFDDKEHPYHDKALKLKKDLKK